SRAQQRRAARASRGSRGTYSNAENAIGVCSASISHAYESPCQPTNRQVAQIGRTCQNARHANNVKRFAHLRRAKSMLLKCPGGRPPLLVRGPAVGLYAFELGGTRCSYSCSRSESRQSGSPYRTKRSVAASGLADLQFAGQKGRKIPDCSRLGVGVGNAGSSNVRVSFAS